MKKNYAVFILLSEAVGLLSSILSSSGIKSYNSFSKSGLTPPAIVFPIVWIILFALMGFAAARIYSSTDSKERTFSLLIFFIQLIVNFFWSIIFFNLNAFGFAFFWTIILWLLIFIMILSYNKIDKIAAYSQIPYLIWITFAAYLTYMVWQLN